MRVGVYVDAYNLYYGGRRCCGRGTPGWRWLDVRGLVRDIVDAQVGWSGARIDRVVYCTARVDAVRARVPVGLVNPRGGYFAGDLTGNRGDGVGNHWWWKMTEKRYRGHQLSDPAGGYTRPAGW